MIGHIITMANPSRFCYP